MTFLATVVGKVQTQLSEGNRNLSDQSAAWKQIARDNSIYSAYGFCIDTVTYENFLGLP